MGLKAGTCAWVKRKSKAKTFPGVRHLAPGEIRESALLDVGLGLKGFPVMVCNVYILSMELKFPSLRVFAGLRPGHGLGSGNSNWDFVE